ncbi:MAG: tRNA glutamyl-Q(34) synthetase GluQRS [Betaproteobacteria bacterium]
MSDAARAPGVGRFAPSPTGPLHFGSLVAALASACDARASGGRWLVRIEDVDEPRAVRGSEREILATLARYGFAPDGPVVRQSDRAAEYAKAWDALDAHGWTYPCACTRRDLDDAPLSAAGERVYPGTCADGIAGERERNPRRSLRVRVGDANVAFVDRLQGEQRQRLARDVGDFVVRRADGLCAYQLAVVVDDAAQEVTHVVRGADLLASTPRQIHLQRALGIPTPSYLHVPVAIAASGEKLSKQTLARALPSDPLPALVAAWRFLEQPPPLALVTLADFWAHALRAWTPARLPPVRMLPAPRFAYAV